MTLDILVQKRRDKTAARRFFRRLVKRTRMVPRVVGPPCDSCPVQGLALSGG
jgi:transposase-like protein